MNDLLQVSATELARRIRKKDVSPVEVVDAHIARIEAVNPHINALVVNTFESARRSAKRAEKKVLKGPSKLPRFFGVPFTVKELISVKGLPLTAGVVARRQEVGADDAPVVKRLRSAGAILLGTTNVAEAGLWLETHNHVYGRTNNPYDTSRIAGGSSGGEAALIAAGGSPMGIGADIGGSIRNPSFFNGICGHKPTGGLIPSTGHWPPADGERGRICVMGPMARTVEDCVGLMQVFSAAFKPLTRVRPQNVTVYYFDSHGLTQVDPEIKRNINETVARLANNGFRVRRWRPPALMRSAEIWSAKVAVTADCSLRELLGNGRAINLLREWLLAPFQLAKHPVYSLIMASLEGLSRAGAKRIRGLLDKCATLQSTIETKLGERGVLICPPYPRPAPRHHIPLLSPFAFTYCGIFNALEFPATAVPTGFSTDGLPLGVQVVGKRMGDPLTLWVAKTIEKNRDRWKPAPLI